MSAPPVIENVNLIRGESRGPVQKLRRIFCPSGRQSGDTKPHQCLRIIGRDPRGFLQRPERRLESPERVLIDPQKEMRSGESRLERYRLLEETDRFFVFFLLMPH